MLVIVKNAEETLFQELKTCWEDFPTYRCLHLRFSQLEQDKEEWLSDVLETLRSHLEGEEGQVYLCHDNDLFVLTRHITHKRTKQILAHLSHKLAPASLAGLAALFEIGVDWPKLKQISIKKIEALKMLQAQARVTRKELLNKRSREDVLKTLDPDLLSSLPMRRESRGKPEIMIVEDDLFSQKMVGNALKNKYSVSMTGDGQGALMGYVNKAPDVLFLDIGLPDIDGHAVLEKIFKLDPDAYVVMFSGNKDRDNVMKAVELGAKGFVGKPFTSEKMLQYIQKSPFIQAKQKKEFDHGNFIH